MEFNAIPLTETQLRLGFFIGTMLIIALALLAAAIYLPRVVMKFRNSDKKTSDIG